MESTIFRDYVGWNIRATSVEEIRQQTWRLEYIFAMLEIRMRRPAGLPIYRIMM